MFAGGGCARQNENTGTDNRSDPQRGETPRTEAFLQTVTRVFRLGHQFIDRFAGKKLVAGTVIHREALPLALGFTKVLEKSPKKSSTELMLLSLSFSKPKAHYFRG